MRSALVSAGMLISWLLPVSLPAAVAPGELLLSEMNCVACHAAEPPVRARLASRESPRLGAAGVRMTAAHLQAFLTDPQGVKPGTLMPDALHALEPARKAEVAEELTHYLLSLQPAEVSAPVAASAPLIRRGGELYHAVGCVQCHAPDQLPPGVESRPEAAAELARLRETSVPLGPLARKYAVADLARFLREPLQARPAGRMPACGLNETEALAVAMYLLRDQAPAGSARQLPGLRYDYYEAPLPELPHFDRLSPKTSGVAAGVSLQVAERKNDFALRFRGR